MFLVIISIVYHILQRFKHSIVVYLNTYIKCRVFLSTIQTISTRDRGSITTLLQVYSWCHPCALLAVHIVIVVSIMCFIYIDHPFRAQLVHRFLSGFWDWCRTGGGCPRSDVLKVRIIC